MSLDPSYAEAYVRMSNLLNLLEALESPLIQQYFTRQRYNTFESAGEDTAVQVGVLYLLLRLCTAPLEASSALRLSSTNSTVNETLLITSDFWSKMTAADVVVYIMDPKAESERLVTDQTLSIVSNNFSYKLDFMTWRVAAGYAGFKRLVPIVGPIYRGIHALSLLRFPYTFEHGDAGILLLTLALLKMPAKQLKGYSKKLRRGIEDFEFEQDLERIRFSHIIDKALRQELEKRSLLGCSAEDAPPALAFMLSADFDYAHKVVTTALNKLVNTVAPKAGEYLSFAAELRQKNGGSLSFDPELLKLLGVDSVQVLLECFSQGKVSFEAEVALAAAVLSSYPRPLMDEIPNLSGRTFDFLQKKLLKYVKNKPSLSGPSLIEFYLKPSANVAELSYLEWCSNLMTAYAESDSGSWRSIGYEAHEITVETVAEDQNKNITEFLPLFLEGDEPELISRDFDFTVELYVERSTDMRYRHYNLGPNGVSDDADVSRHLELADIYRRVHLKLGKNVDKKLYPRWHEVDGEEGLFFVELPRFHPLWWVIGSTSIANCCMTPDNVGYTSCRSGFWGNRDRSFILVHEPTSTVIGSLQAIGGKLGRNSRGWELIFDGMEFRNPQKEDSAAQQAILKQYGPRNFDDNENIKAWLRGMLPYLPAGSGGGFSGYVEYLEEDSDMMIPRGETREIPQGFVFISDTDSAYRDFALPTNPCTSRDPVRLAGKDFTEIRVEDYEFNGLDLSSCDFSEGRFETVNFINCKLTNAVFHEAVFNEVTFEVGTDIAGASFKKAIFEGPVVFDEYAHVLNISEASFADVQNLKVWTTFPDDFTPPEADQSVAFSSPSGIVIEGTFKGTSFTDQEFLAKVRYSSFEDVDFRDVRFNSPAHFAACSFKMVSFAGSRFSSFTFLACEFEDCVFTRADLQYLSFTECTFKNCDFDTANFNHVEFDRCTIKETFFQNAELWAVRFRRSTVSHSYFNATTLDISVQDSSFAGSTFDEDVEFKNNFTREMFEDLGAELEE